MTELYKKYRPRELKRLVGQPQVVASLNEWVSKEEFPHAIMLSGPSGTGKTTVARIIRQQLQCADIDYSEYNCANFRGIDLVREIIERVELRPLGGLSRVWVIDESHQLTSPAQDAFLKVLEDSPAHAYFLLATTEPERLKKTIRTRCYSLKFKPLDNKSVEYLVSKVAAAEKAKLSPDAVAAIVEVAAGSARKALVLLDQVMSRPVADQEKAVRENDIDQEAITIARELFRSKPDFTKIAKVLASSTVAAEVEGVRHLILKYAETVLLRAGGSGRRERAFAIIRIFQDHCYDSHRPGLSALCWEACSLLRQ